MHSTEELEILGLHDNIEKSFGRHREQYNASGYRSNEIDEGTELNKLTAINAIACH